MAKRSSGASAPVPQSLPTAKEAAEWFERYAAAGLDPIHWELTTPALVSKKGYKGPREAGWKTAVYSAPPVDAGGVWQMGLRLGTACKNAKAPHAGRFLCVVDIEDRNDELRVLAETVLPPTRLIGGKGGDQRSHRFYWTEAPMNTFSWKGPRTDGGGQVGDRTTVLELLGCGRDGEVAHQVVVAPSVHLDRGCRYEWGEFGPAAHVTCAELFAACRTLVGRVANVELSSGKGMPPTGSGGGGVVGGVKREAQETMGLGGHKVSAAVTAARGMPDSEAVDVIGDAVARIAGLAEGERNSGINLLCFTAASLLAGGGRGDADFAALRDGALEACEALPGTPELRAWSDTIDRAIRDGRRKPRIRAGLRKYALTSQGLADLLADEWHDHYRFVWEWKSWIRWNGRIWEPVPCQEHILRSMVTILRWAQIEAARGPQDAFRDEAVKFYYRCESGETGAKAAALLRDEAEGGKGLGISVKELDCNPYLFAVQNGVFDIKAGVLRDFARDDLITRIAPYRYNPSSECPKFQAHLDWALGGKEDSKELVDYFSRWLGYGLTGLAGEQAMMILVGKGANGKSFIMDTCLEVIGSGYGIQAARELVLKIKNDTKNKDEILDLEGRRFAVVSEPDPGQYLSEGVVKALTGSRAINVKGMYAKPRPIEITSKIFMDANHIPRVSGMEFAIYRRLKIVSFNNRISPEMRINDYWRIVVAAEGDGILSWLLNHAHRYVRDGMPAEPASLKRALVDFKTSADTIGTFLTERCDVCSEMEDMVLHRKYKVSAAVLYDAYSNYTKSTGCYPCSARAFGEAVREFKDGAAHAKRTAAGMAYVGVRLRELGDPVETLEKMEQAGEEAEDAD